MAERQPPPTDVELERALSDLGAHLAYPPTPDLVSAVRRRVAEPPARLRPRLLRLAALAALLTLLLGAAAIAVFPTASAVLADRLGLRGIRIFYTAAVPTTTLTPLATLTPAPSAAPLAGPAALPAPIPTPTPVGTGLRLGAQLSLADARGKVAYAILMPTAPDLGPPDEIYLGDPPAGGQVALVYRARPALPVAAGTGVGLLLTEFHADLVTDYFGKGLGPGTRLEAVTVSGERGYWIEGQPHLFFYLDSNGNVHDEQFRLAGNALLWEHNGITFRLEAPISKDAALRIAESMR